MVLPAGKPFGEVGFAFKPFLKGCDSLLIFVCNLCIRDRAKAGGFSGGLRFLMAPSEPKSFDVESSVVVSVQLTATLTRMPAFRECLFANGATT
jgi:hypothetical protein